MVSVYFRLTALVLGILPSGLAGAVNVTILERADNAVTHDGGSSRGVAWGDFDNDGDADLAISNTDGQPLFLYRNAGNGRFEHITAPPFDRFRGDSEGIVWVDFDNDGWLDVFVVNRGGQDDILYRNSRGQTFNQLNGPFTGRGGDGRSCATGDADGDGLPDIYVGNFLEPGETPPRKAVNFFYLNIGDGFREVVRGHFVNTPSLTYGASFVDFDQDGDLDLFVTNIALSDRNLLYENLGRARFYPREELVLSTDSLGPSKGHSWGDFDNDGDLDLIVTEGTENITADEKVRGYDTHNRLYLNDGKGHFAAAKGPFTADEAVSAGAAWADYDGDGDLDIAVANWGGNGEDNAFYDNHGGGNRISLVLQGVRSNRQGFGAQIVITSSLEKGPRIQRRWLWPQTGYASMNEAVLHFGLGSAEKVDRIRIYWPSGTVDEYDERPANARYRAIEGKSLLQIGAVAGAGKAGRQ